jgi:hemolysin III
MKDRKAPIVYSPLEEKINVVSHAAGLVLSIVALVLLVVRAAGYGDAWRIVSFSIFGVSLIVQYAASTFYHNAKNPVVRNRLRIFDHATIFVLIAGTYTPFTLVTLNGVAGWVIFGITWGVAIAGVILKIFYTGRFNTLSTVMYVLMGWIIIIVIKPLVNNLSSGGLFWLALGGAFYTAGAVLFSIKRIKFNHAIFHIFVLLGSFCHFISVFYYV